MPTPFMHLNAAYRYLKDESVSPSIRDFLGNHLGAFLLGNIAPDARVSGGINRGDTHFFEYGATVDPHAVTNMLTLHPELQATQDNHRAFVAGYVAHLAMDVVWAVTMLYRYFYKRADWADSRTRFNMLHVLLCHLDAKDYRQWPELYFAALKSAQPNKWMPVISDKGLAEWRDLITNQICPGCESNTVKLLGGRVDIGADGLQAILDSETRMETELWRYVPQAVVSEIEIQMYDDMKIWLEKYLSENNS